MLDLSHARYRYQTPTTPDSDTLYWYPVLHYGRVTSNINLEDPRLRFMWFGPVAPGKSAPDHDTIRQAVKARLIVDGKVSETPIPAHVTYGEPSPLRKCCADLCDPAKLEELANRVRTTSEAAPDPEPAVLTSGARGSAKTSLTLNEIEAKMHKDLADHAVTEALRCVFGGRSEGTGRSSVTYEEAVVVAREVWALIEDGNAHCEAVVTARVLRALANEDVELR